MPLIHHLALSEHPGGPLGVERNVGERAVPIWTAQPRPGWLPGPLPDELRPPPDPRFVPALPAPPERTEDEVLAEIAEAAAANPLLNEQD